MRIFYNILALIIVFMILPACEEETSWKYKSGNPIIVVDALITSENTNQTIRINQSYQKLNQQGEPVTDALVYLLADGDTTYFNESAIPGNYSSPAILPQTSKIYTLHVLSDGIHDSATAVMEPVSGLRQISLIQKDTLYKVIDSGSDLPAFTEIHYDWSHKPDYCSYYGACEASETFYNLDIVDISKEFAPEKQEVLFPSGTIIIRKKHSLTENHKEFLRNLLIETEWRGGLFDSEQGNIPTNFSNGLNGWFAICQVITDTTFVP